MMSTIHHVLGPSSLPRISKCIGSLYGPGRGESSPAAREGTACHTLLEFCLSMGANPHDLIGMTDFDAEFPVTLEMAEAVELFIDTVKAACDEFQIPHDQIKSEEKIVCDIIPNQLFGGTMDCQAAGGDTLIVADLKFGRKQVYADSLQLTAYSLLSLGKLERVPDRVVQLLIQPRGNPQVSRYEVGQTELAEAWDIVSNAAKFLLENPDRSSRLPKEYLAAGEHCLYCNQAEGCTAREAMAVELVTLGTFASPDEGKLIAAPTQEIPTDVLVEWVNKSDVIKAFLDDAKRALVVRAAQGQEIPGKKLVPNYGHRKWVEEDLELMKKKIPKAKLGLTTKEIMVTKLATPAQVEKLLKEKGTLKEVKERFNRLTQSPLIGVKLVDLKSRGEAIRPETATEFLNSLKNLEESSDE